MKVTITGKVTGVIEDYKALLLIIEQSEGIKTNTVAVRCWSNTTKQRAESFTNGDVVEVFGLISSRRGKTGDRWFTSFEAEGFRVVQAAEQKPQRTASPYPPPSEPPAHGDDDDVPF